MTKTRPIGRRVRPLRPEERIPLPPLDKDLSYYREGTRWSFSDGKVFLDGYDVSRILTESEGISTWLGLAGGIDEYRKKILSRAHERDQFTRFEAVTSALLGKIFSKVKKVYDQKKSGLAWAIENGQLILNGINVRSFLALYRLRKTDKARRYLEGLRTNLRRLLADPDQEKAKGLFQELYDELEEELAIESSVGAHRRLGPGPPLGR